MHPTLQRIHQLAANEPVEHGPRRTFRTYAYELIPLEGDTTYTMYVGQTRYSIETRHRHHLEGRNSCRHIRRNRYAVGELRADLCADLPKFRCEACAKKAEGYLADYVDAIGERSYSDQGTAHAKRHAKKQARKARREARNA